MSSHRDPVWSFFASVKLALILLLLLALASIIGTILPQGEEYAVYAKQFGPQWAQVLHILNLDNMYRAWWFLSLLAFLAANLIVCSLDRLPQVWKLATADPLALSVDRISSMKNSVTVSVEGTQEAARKAVMHILSKHRFGPTAKELSGHTLIAGQTGGWTRFGVYIVHLSILVIMIGTIIGTALGFKAFVMLPETRTTDTVYASDANQTPIPLGFAIRCDRFTLDYYANGMPSEYRSDLTVLDQGKPVLKQHIVVNDPLTYKGITFYQASYQPYDTYFLTLSETKDKIKKTFAVPPGKERKWDEAGVSFGILNVQGPDRMGKYRLKIWFSDTSKKPAVFWLDSGAGAEIPYGDRSFFITSKQAFATGLQVAKDPGVWGVYIGSILMLFGLFVAFFTSHKRVWIVLGKNGDTVTLLVAGSANKHRDGFARKLQQISSEIESTLSAKEASS